MIQAVRRRSHSVTLVAVLFGAFSPIALRAQTTSIWVGQSGNYSDDTNWHTSPVVPINGNDLFNVIIAPNSSSAIAYDLMTTSQNCGEIQSLTLGSNSNFEILPNRCLAVLDSATLGGVMRVSRSSFSSPDSFASAFTGNRARVLVEDGGYFEFGATGTYSATGLTSGFDSWSALDLFWADGCNTDGACSVLDLSSLGELNDAFNIHNSLNHYHRIRATSGGHIDLSGLHTIYGPGSRERLQFIADSESSIDLDNLSSIVKTNDNGYTVFDVDPPLGDPVFRLPQLGSAENTNFTVDLGTLSLPKVASLSGVTFSMASGTQLEIPVLGTYAGGSWTIPVGATVYAPALSTMDGVSLYLDADAVLDAPNLASFTRSTVTLAPDRTLLPSANGLDPIDNSRIFVKSGATFGTTEIATNYYSATGLTSGFDSWNALDLFWADGCNTDGACSVLDLSSLGELNDAFNINNSLNHYHRIRATGGGHIDLSGLHTIYGPGGGERLQFIADSESSIDLDNLSSIIKSSDTGRVIFDADGGNIALGVLLGAENASFEVSRGGTMTLGGMSAVADVSISVDGLGSILSVDGSVHLGGNTLSVTNGGEIVLKGDLTSRSANEAAFSSQTGVMKAVGHSLQWLEIGGTDVGPAPPGNSGNFGWGQMVIGTPSTRAAVELVDFEDNGNRGAGGEPEALYLYGIGGTPGLRISRGSTLILADLNAYAWVGGEWLHLNSLLPPGTDVIAFDDGYIARWDMVAVGDCDFDMAVDLLDVEDFEDCFAGPEADPDPPGCGCADNDSDGDVDLADFAVVQRFFTGS